MCIRDRKEAGYFYFNPDHLILQVDSTIGKNRVNVNVTLKRSTPEAALKPYTIRNINIFPSYNLRRDSVPVSYTHLDVYKRQVLVNR